ncbi:hypothetical protein Naga_100235g13 [Nannochloropsis gaditana]|uniref:Uncharacterized protein n=1 Tax=Nannochloropsis gaditana TaxID=72520 RepID=W7THV8_9STRA|nr:hypothetical protein Naga_100235g13 [Nannochloropsis gaditana]
MSQREAGLVGSEGEGEHVFVRYEAPFPKDAPHVGNTATVRTGLGHAADFNHRAKLPLPRLGSTEHACRRRSLNFLVRRRKKGLLKWWDEEETITHGQLSLAPLLSQCDLLEVSVPLAKEGRRRPMGGSLTVSLRLHHPLKEKEIAREEGRTLVVGPWSTGRLSPTAASKEESQGLPEKERKDALAARFAEELTELEREDPLNASLLVSNDVLEHELSLLAASNPEKLLESERVIREAELNMKLNLLVLRVQREEITIDQYVSTLVERVKRDKVCSHLHFWCFSLPRSSCPLPSYFSFCFLRRGRSQCLVKTA